MLLFLAHSKYGSPISSLLPLTFEVQMGDRAKIWSCENHFAPIRIRAKVWDQNLILEAILLSKT